MYDFDEEETLFEQGRERSEARYKIVNLTQHDASENQKLDGVFDLPEPARSVLRALLTFDRLPSRADVEDAAQQIALLAESTGAKSAMIGGAPFLMSQLELALELSGIAPVYAFSRRESIETSNPDGSVVKTNIFKHAGFVPAT
jgi:hypothetical protein